MPSYVKNTNTQIVGTWKFNGQGCNISAINVNGIDGNWTVEYSTNSGATWNTFFTAGADVWVRLKINTNTASVGATYNVWINATNCCGLVPSSTIVVNIVNAPCGVVTVSNPGAFNVPSPGTASKVWQIISGGSLLIAAPITDDSGLQYTNWSAVKEYSSVGASGPWNTNFPSGFSTIWVRVTLTSTGGDEGTNKIRVHGVNACQNIAYNEQTVTTI